MHMHVGYIEGGQTTLQNDINRNGDNTEQAYPSLTLTMTTLPTYSTQEPTRTPRYYPMPHLPYMCNGFTQPPQIYDAYNTSTPQSSVRQQQQQQQQQQQYYLDTEYAERLRQFPLQPQYAIHFNYHTHHYSEQEQQLMNLSLSSPYISVLRNSSTFIHQRPAPHINIHSSPPNYALISGQETLSSFGDANSDTQSSDTYPLLEQKQQQQQQQQQHEDRTDTDTAVLSALTATPPSPPLQSNLRDGLIESIYEAYPEGDPPPPNTSRDQWCPACRQQFSRKRDLVRHLKRTRAHTANNLYLCQYCNVSFHRADTLVRHTRAIHANPRHPRRRSARAIPNSSRRTR
ncbi:hypothetical protein BX666DRAFT_2113635, partial [Dichotomocladium elegans]